MLAATLAGSLALARGIGATEQADRRHLDGHHLFRRCPSLANFNTARVGDTVSVGLENRLTFVLSDPRARVPAGRELAVAATPRSART